MARKSAIIIPTLSLTHCLIAIFTLLFLIHWLALPKITHISKLNDKKISYNNLLLPLDIAIHNKGRGKHTYKFRISADEYQQRQFIIYPQECIYSIKINGLPAAFPFHKRCGFGKGIVLDLNNMLRKGSNTLVIKTEAPGIAIGPLMFSKGQWKLLDYLNTLLIAFTMMAIALFGERLTKDRFTGYCLAAGFLLYLYVISHTTFMWNKYDMPQHLEYITFIANKLWLPKTYSGFLTYHPPLYYTLQAIILRIANLLSSFEVISVLRIFNLFCFMSFLMFGVLILKHLITNKLAYQMAVLLLIFYPGGPTIAGRMDSNLLFYPLFAGCLYFIARWLSSYSYRDLALCIAFCGLALATRSNALVLFPIIGLAVLYQWKKHSFMSLLTCLKKRMIWLAILVLILGAIVNFGRVAYDNSYTNRDQSYIVANAAYLASIASGLRIGNSWDNYTSFNLNAYFHPPYFNVWSGHGGRYYFWMTVMKSSMYGEFEFPNRWIAINMNGILLFFIAYILATMALNWRKLKQQPEWAMGLIGLLIPISGLAANRILHPIACSQDFRYVYASILCFCGLMGFAIQQHLNQQRMVMASVGLVSVACFVVLTILFYALMFDA